MKGIHFQIEVHSQMIGYYETLVLPYRTRLGTALHMSLRQGSLYALSHPRSLITYRPAPPSSLQCGIQGSGPAQAARCTARAHALVAARDEDVSLGLIEAHNARLAVGVVLRISRRPLLGDLVD